MKKQTETKTKKLPPADLSVDVLRAVVGGATNTREEARK